ncbi:MAG: transposase [Nannocystales bacterium]
MTRVKVHAWVVMSNHLHLVVTDTYGERPRFMGLLDAELGKAASALIGRWGGFWEPGRSYSAVDLLDRNAVLEKLAYTLANPVLSKLVRCARRWPGATSVRLRFGDVVVARRPSGGYYANSCQPESYTFRLEVPPGMDAVECRADVRLRMRKLEKEAEDGVAACVQLGLSGLGPGPARTLPCAVEPMLVSGFGMQLHAAVWVDGRDRKRLERVCRYLLRPPFALGAVQRTADGQVRVHFKKPSRNGATYAQMSPERFLARLCALVPPPGAHTVRYYGVLAPRHALRARVVPTPEATNIPPKQLSLFVPQGQLELAANTGPALDKQLLDVAPHRLSWMSLLARVFRFDVSVCQRCQGPMRVVRAVSSPDEIAEALHAARPPPRPSPRGQLMLFSGLSS